MKHFHFTAISLAAMTLVCTVAAKAEIPAPQNAVLSAPHRPGAYHQWTGNFTGTGDTEILVHRPDGFYLSQSQGDQLSWQFAGATDGYLINDETLYVGDLALSGRLSLAFFDQQQQAWIRGSFTGSQLVWQTLGSDKMLQVVVGGPVLFATANSNTPTVTATASEAITNSVKPADNPTWPVHSTRRDHVTCGDVQTDLFLYPDGSVQGTMSLKGTCWLAGTHASMAALISDANGNLLYATPSLRLGVNPGQTVTASLSNPRYNLNIPGSTMALAHGVSIAQKYDPNDITKIISDIVKQVLSILAALGITLF